MFLITQLLGISLTAQTVIHPLPHKPLTIHFNQHKTGYYQGDLLKQDWKNVSWDGTRQRARVLAERNHNKFIRVSYPKSGVGPTKSGSQFLVPIPESEAYYLSFRVRFNRGFDFKKGGKLPGLASGYGKYSNGKIPRDGKGWTARLMWIEEGELVPYLYYVGMPKANRWGEFWKMQSYIKPNQWHTITQYIRLNKGGQRNGTYSIWIDGKRVTHKTNMLWRYGNYGKIDSFLFSTYHGGASAPWAPRWHSFADFDDFIIATQPPKHLNLPQR